jgi:myo-inositol-1(or 4)-monophosphatase
MQQSAKRMIKPDNSWVTEADREVEKLLQEQLSTVFPGSAFWGEESGHAADAGNGLWVVDPIDGTSNFVHGLPLWAVTAGWFRGGEAQVAAAHIPALGETYIAERGLGVFLNGEPLPPLAGRPLDKTDVTAVDVDYVFDFPLSGVPGRKRKHGAFVIEACFMASGRLRAVVSAGERLYDIVLGVLMTEMLGGRVCYLDGSALDWDSLFAGETIDRPWALWPPGVELPDFDRL